MAARVETSGVQSGTAAGATMGWCGLGPAVVRAWLHPRRVMADLRGVRGIGVGLRAVLLRFDVTDLVETLPLMLAGRIPFRRSALPVSPERHYRVQALLLPVLGMGIWLAMGGVGHVTLRASGRDNRLGAVLDVVGVGMLVPMPPLWASDVVMIAADRFRLSDLAITHSVVELWEAALFAVGLREVLGVPARPALALGLAMAGVYVVAAAPVVR